MHIDKVSIGPNPPYEVNAIIEIPALSAPIKYEFDKEAGAIVVDRFVTTCMQYPCNYGFIPHTLSEDGDPLDVLVITPFPLHSGVVVRVRPVGVLNMTDEAGVDLKIVAVPVDKLTPLYRNIQSPDDLPELLRIQLIHFFEHYKDLEPGKWVKVDGWQGSKEAFAAIEAGMLREKKPT